MAWTTSWGARAVRSAYHRAGYLEDGERAAFASVGDDALNGARILDLAVGGGRTTAFLAPVAGTYLGVDISPEMLRMARSRYPGVAFAEGDLGDLSGFADASWDVIDISFNSIDVLPHDRRLRTLSDIHRMLVPGGHLVLSMLLLADGPPDAPSLGELAPVLTGRGWRHPRMRARQTLSMLLGFWHYHRNSAARPPVPVRDPLLDAAQRDRRPPRRRPGRRRRVVAGGPAAAPRKERHAAGRGLRALPLPPPGGVAATRQAARVAPDPPGRRWRGRHQQDANASGRAAR
jgi:SAM-dependent methyltransferase